MTLDKNIKRKYNLQDYDQNWVKKFDELKLLLQSIFGSKALKIEHVGSTAIPGMKAKPIIDILVVVEKMEKFLEQKEKMVSLGYEWGENYIAPNTQLFFKIADDGSKTQNIHICEYGSPKERQFLVMRDFFRTFPEKLKEYADLKEKNHALHPDDYPAYREAKAPFVKRIERAAYEWEEALEKVSFVNEKDIREKIESLFQTEKENLQKLLPDSQIEHIGGTSVANSITKGDLDINIRVSEENFQTTIEILKKIYRVNQPNNWTKSYASFKDDSRDLGVQLTIIDSADDYFVKQRDFLNSNPEKVLELNKIKLSFEGKNMDDYRKEKGKFFNRF